MNTLDWKNGTVSYGLWNRPVAISEGGYGLTIDYGADGARRHTRHLENNVLRRTVTRVSPLHEVETTATTTRRLDYIFAEGRIAAVHVGNGAADSLYYVLTDHLGSWEIVLDQSKNAVQRTHFNPWGNRMSYTAWSTRQTQAAFPFSRGFTGHEHYDRFKIVNAGARLYDPVIGRFFSPDPFVQTPDFTQGFNRYSYCLNNPVMFSDPTGEVFVIDDAIIIGAMVGAFFGGVKADQKGENFLGGMVKGAFIGGLGGALGGIGGAGMSYAENLFLGVWEGGFTGYVDGLVWGEDPRKSMLYGMASGAVVTTLTSENLWNFFRGKGFKTNANVFEDFKAGKYSQDGGVWQQDAIDYFFGKGNGTISSKYDNDAWYNTVTGINYTDGAFTSYNDLLCSYTKESFERIRHQTNTWAKPDNPTGEFGIDIFYAEYIGHLQLYKNQGLYPKTTTDLIKPINNCIKMMKMYNILMESQIFSIPSNFEEKWWYFIYKLPRRY